MKKVLFATTALVATAGVASADVALSGLAQMGIMGGDGMETQFVQDIDVTFTMSGETDNGLTFGAAVDLDEDAGAVGADDAGTSVFISGNFGTLTMGDTDGALDWALTEAGNVANPGSINDDETGHDGYLGSYGDGIYDGQILRYDYSIGDFGIAVSAEMDDDGDADYGYAIGFRYGLALSGVDVDLGLGYQSANEFAAIGEAAAIGPMSVDPTTGATDADVTILGVSAAATFDNGLSAGVVYSIWDISGTFDGAAVDAEVTHTGVGLGYSFDAFSVHANYGVYDDGAGMSEDGYGLSAAYDLGGGAGLHLGFGSDDASDTYSFGLSMSF